MTEPTRLDAVEQEYRLAMSRARNEEEALDLEIGLRQYREMFKPLFPERPEGDHTAGGPR